MAIKILMPALSPTMKKGNIRKWYKNEGDMVEAGEVIADIETDKAIMEFIAGDGGILAKILVPEGSEDVPVKTLIAILAEEGENTIEFGTESSGAIGSVKSDSSLNNIEHSGPGNFHDDNTEEVTFGSKDLTNQARIVATPLARKTAILNDLDLSKVVVNSKRIYLQDVLATLKNLKQEAHQQLDSINFHNGQGRMDSYVLKKPPMMRKTIAKRLVTSKQEIPHFYLEFSVEMDECLTLRSKINQNSTNKISVNDMVVKATALALRDEPQNNVIWAEDGLRYFDNVNLAVAVSVDGGLFTPVLWVAEKRSLSDLSLAIKDLVAKARNNQLKPQDFEGGVMSISNLGMYGIDSFKAIINPPQSSILAVGAVKPKIALNFDGNIQTIAVMRCTLSIDHRAIDGVDAAKFSSRIKYYLENPLLLLI